MGISGREAARQVSYEYLEFHAVELPRIIIGYLVGARLLAWMVLLLLGAAKLMHTWTMDAVQKCNRSHILENMMSGAPHPPHMRWHFRFFVSRSATASGFVWRSRTGGSTTTSGRHIVRR